MKKLLAAALFLVLATPAFAAVQNVKVDGDITETYLDRSDFDLGLDVNRTPVGLKSQSVGISQVRVNVEADLSDNVSTFVGLLNERAWNAENTDTYVNSSGNTVSLGNAYANDTDVELYKAYITMREFLYSPLTITVGRQVFNYGNGLIMGDGGVNNLSTGNLAYIAQDLTERTAYDGIKATLDYKPLSIDMFYFKNGETLGAIEGIYNNKKSNSDVFGYDANYQLSDPWSTLVETYMFARIDGSGNNGAALDAFVPASTGPQVTDKNDTLFVPGLRASTNPIKNLNVQGEIAWQAGNHPVVDSLTGAQTTEHRDAMAAQFLASYSLPVLDKYKPSVNASYTYVSGDKDATANTHDVPYTSAKTFSAWDPFNEIQGGGTIYNTLFALTDMHIVAIGASAAPLEDVTTSFTWSGLWAAQSYGPYNPLELYQPNGGTAQIAPATKGGNTGLGNEYDVNLSYNYTEDVTFGVSLGWFVPGDAFSSTNRDTASQALANVMVKF